MSTLRNGTPQLVATRGPDITSYPIDGLPEAGLIHDADGWKFYHRCDRGPRGVVVCAPMLAAAHSVTYGWRDGIRWPTVSPSILCPDCGAHGFVTAGRWADAPDRAVSEREGDGT